MALAAPSSDPRFPSAPSIGMESLVKASGALGAYALQLENAREAIHEAEQALHVASLKALDVKQGVRAKLEVDDSFAPSVRQELRQLLDRIRARQTETRRLRDSIKAELSRRRAQIFCKEPF